MPQSAAATVIPPFAARPNQSSDCDTAAQGTLPETLGVASTILRIGVRVRGALCRRQLTVSFESNGRRDRHRNVSTAPTLTIREVADMKLSNWLPVPSAFVLASLLMCLSGCVVHDREVVHDGGYAQGYKEGYYDHEHNRWWHNQAWQDCVDNDTHCH
jgi:hypothetical protein